MTRIPLALGLACALAACAETPPTEAAPTAAVPPAPSTQAYTVPEGAPPEFQQAPSIWDERTELGVAGHWYAEGSMSFFANHASQATTLYLRKSTGESIGATEPARAARAEFYPFIGHFVTRAVYPFTPTCGTSIQGVTTHHAYHEYGIGSVRQRWGDTQRTTQRPYSFEPCPIRNGGTIAGIDGEGCEWMTYEISYDGGRTWQPYGAPFRRCNSIAA